MNAWSAIFCLLTGIAGWFYLFYSKGADHLAEIEDVAANTRRARLRRLGGGVMLLLAIALYIGFYVADEQARPILFVGVWSVVIVLILLLVVLALLDVRLTRRLRERKLRRTRGLLIDRDRSA